MNIKRHLRNKNKQRSKGISLKKQVQKLTVILFLFLCFFPKLNYIYINIKYIFQVNIISITNLKQCYFDFILIVGSHLDWINQNIGPMIESFNYLILFSSIIFASISTIIVLYISIGDIIKYFITTVKLNFFVSSIYWKYFKSNECILVCSLNKDHIIYSEEFDSLIKNKERYYSLINKGKCIFACNGKFEFKFLPFYVTHQLITSESKFFYDSKFRRSCISCLSEHYFFFPNSNEKCSTCMSDIEKLSDLGYRRCPGCKIEYERINGCLSVTCSNCNRNFSDIPRK